MNKFGFFENIMLFCLVILSAWSTGEVTFGSILPDEAPPSIAKSNPVNLLFQNKCMEALGCFYTGPPFYHPIHRPISLTPTDISKTKFILFTPTNPEDGGQIEATEASIQNSSFDPQLPVKVLIHGFFQDLEMDDLRFQMKDALLKGDDYNVIVVDWTQHNKSPYPQAVANARAVGALLANLLKLIMSYTGVQPQNIHIAGHSLGGHVAGWAGERIEGLGRITGIDPAGPYFQDAENSVRLDTTDAVFVDVIHSNGGENIMDGLGIGDPVGHMDFYPNGGMKQPGCSLEGLLEKVSKENDVGAAVNITAKFLQTPCDHTRADNYFLESIDNSRCRFLATLCNSYDDFEKGDCLPQNSTLSEMGFHAKPIPGVPIKSKFYLRTNDASPFCIENSV